MARRPIGRVVRCPACRPAAARVTRANGSQIGWSPEALYVGYLDLPAFLGPRVPASCPNCRQPLERRDGP